MPEAYEPNERIPRGKRASTLLEGPASPDLRTQVRPWRVARNGLATWQLFSTIGIWTALWYVSTTAWSWSAWLALLTVPFHSVIMVRLFILQHDCSHHSFFASKRANDLVGFWLGTMLLTPFREWRRSHAIHHATSSCLERRNSGDIYTMTIEQYLQERFWKRIVYRLVRNPLVMLGIGPIYVFVFKQRLKGSLCPGLPRGRRLVNVQCTTLSFGLLLYAGCCLLGTAQFLTIWGLSFWMAGAVGVFLFYMQHNFESPYYSHARADYSFERAALEGSSFFDLPRWAHWCTGNIGYHHIHHLDPLIPNYQLPACHQAVFQKTPLRRLGFWSGLATLRFKLFDPDCQRMITWRELARSESYQCWRRSKKCHHEV